MAIVTADTNGGRYNNVHRQTDDGIVFSVAVNNNLMPITFRYTDYLGDCHITLIAGSFYPHANLMRGDCGWRAKDDSGEILFSWNSVDKVLDGFIDTPTGEFEGIWHDEPTCAENVRVPGIRSHQTTYFKKDREYWTPNMTLMADVPEDPFAFTDVAEYNTCCVNPKPHDVTTIKQWNPITCDPVKPDKCGLVQFNKRRKG